MMTAESPDSLFSRISDRESLYDAGTYMFLRLLLPGDNRYIETFARVVRHVDAPTENLPELVVGVGVEFLGAAADQLEALSSFLDDSADD